MSDTNTNDDDTTKSTKTRWVGTGTAAAIMLLSTLCGALLAFVWRSTDVPLWASFTFSAAALSAVAWAFGSGALKAATGALRKK